MALGHTGGTTRVWDYLRHRQQQREAYRSNSASAMGPPLIPPRPIRLQSKRNSEGTKPGAAGAGQQHLEEKGEWADQAA